MTNTLNYNAECYNEFMLIFFFLFTISSHILLFAHLKLNTNVKPLQSYFLRLLVFVLRMCKAILHK